MTREEQQDLLEQAIHYIYDEDNPEAGLQCLQRAAEGGLPEAMQEYAIYLLVQKNDTTAAVDWFEKCYRSGYPFDLRELYSEGTPAFRAAIDARFTAEEKKAMRIHSQAFYDTMSRLITCLFLMGAGHKLGECFDHPYAAYIGMGIGLVLAACLCKHISYSSLMQLGQNKES
ncbi:MAG: hypothetical protein IKL98_00295 [Akkermansia sp.]|nr:hypothetical protein [Akkermansia sp.]